ncbi:hypothetical protein [Streptosporangium sp. NPDC006930]|uniref:hypothetical protein n=1 Tax=Streptosporangium sp. NPDC006930 TaxID=3154783 RepID=UPI003442DF16
MTMRYFEIRSPRADFTGKVGAVAFADGVARVSFDDTRTDGECLADENGVQVGRSAVLFAQRRPGYTVTETDELGRPLPEPEEKPKRRTPAKQQTPAKESEQKQGDNTKKEGDQS